MGVVASGGDAVLIARGGAVATRATSGAATLPAQTPVPVLHRTWTQASPDTMWVVGHGLGYRPLVQVYDASGVLVLCDVEHDAAALTFRCYFNTPTAGTAEYE